MRIIWQLTGLSAILTLLTCGNEATFSSGERKPEISPSSGDAKLQQETRVRQALPARAEVSESAKQADPAPFRERFLGQDIRVYKPIDIVFLFDASGSMNQEIDKLESSMEAFLLEFDLKYRDLDYKLWLISDQSKFDFSATILDHPKVHLIDRFIGSHDSLDVFLEIYDDSKATSTLKDVSREKELVIISDDDAVMTPSAFLDHLAKRAIANWGFSGLIGLTPGRNNDWCHIAAVGKRYQEISGQKRGVVLDLCDENWRKLLLELADHIIHFSSQAEFPLSEVPNLKEPISVTVNAQEVAAEHYRYSSESVAILFDGSLKPRAGDIVEVTYY